MERFIEYINSLKRTDRVGYCMFLKACLFLSGEGQFGQEDVAWLLDDFRSHNENAYIELVDSINKEDSKKVLIDSMNLFSMFEDAKQTIKELKELFLSTSSLVQEFGELLSSFNFGDAMLSVADPCWIMRSLNSSEFVTIANKLAEGGDLPKKLGSHYVDIVAITQMFTIVDPSNEFISDLFTKVVKIPKGDRKVFSDSGITLDQFIEETNQLGDHVQVVHVSKKADSILRDSFKSNRKVTFMRVDPRGLSFKDILDRAEIDYKDMDSDILDGCNALYQDHVVNDGEDLLIVVEDWSANSSINILTYDPDEYQCVSIL